MVKNSNQVHVIEKISRFIFLILTSFPVKGYCHEPWLLTPNQLKLLKEKPAPEIFSSWNITNISFIFIFIIILMMFHIFHYYLKKYNAAMYKKGRSLELDHGNIAPLILRVFTAGTLIIAAFGLIPQSGYPRYSPTLLLPDIHLSNSLLWLRIVEIILAAGLITGLYVRLQGGVLFLLTCLACFLYPTNMFLYAGYFFGISLFLILTDTHHLIMAKSVLGWPDKKNCAKFLLQLLTGVTFILSGFYKVLFPWLDISLLSINHSFTFYIPYDIFTLLMAMTEISAGILIITGALLRVVALLLFLPFLYLGYILNENILAHLFLYGILVSFIVNGSFSD